MENILFNRCGDRSRPPCPRDRDARRGRCSSRLSDGDRRRGVLPRPAVACEKRGHGSINLRSFDASDGGRRA